MVPASPTLSVKPPPAAPVVGLNRSAWRDNDVQTKADAGAHGSGRAVGLPRDLRVVGQRDGVVCVERRCLLRARKGRPSAPRLPRAGVGRILVLSAQAVDALRLRECCGDDLLLFQKTGANPRNTRPHVGARTVWPHELHIDFVRWAATRRANGARSIDRGAGQSQRPRKARARVPPVVAQPQSQCEAHAATRFNLLDVWPRVFGGSPPVFWRMNHARSTPSVARHQEQLAHSRPVPCQPQRGAGGAHGRDLRAPRVRPWTRTTPQPPSRCPTTRRSRGRPTARPEP